jgi:hypothetical protein
VPKSLKGVLRIDDSRVGRFGTSANKYFLRGNELYKRLKLNKAIKECWEAINDNSDSSDAHANLAGSLNRKSMLGEAIQEYRTVLRLNLCNKGLY